MAEFYFFSFTVFKFHFCSFRNFLFVKCDLSFCKLGYGYCYSLETLTQKKTTKCFSFFNWIKYVVWLFASGVGGRCCVVRGCGVVSVE
jgi:hypothetical protein